MAIAVTTVASGGLPVTDVTATNTRLGLHVAEVAKGLRITKGPGGLPVNFAPVADWPPASGGGGGGGGGAEATAFLARTSGLDATHTNAYIALIDGLVADGIWAKLDMLHVYATQNSTTALLNLVSTSYNGTVNNSPAFTADRGFTGVDGSSVSSPYIDTGFIPATATTPKFVQNSAHISAWSVTNLGSLANPIMGTRNLYGVLIYPSTGSSVAYFLANNAYGANVSNANSSGHFIASRSSSSSVLGYRNGTGLYTGSEASTVPESSVITTLAGNHFGSTVDASSYQCAMASIGSSLNATEALAFYNRLNTYMMAVGAVVNPAADFLARTTGLDATHVNAYTALINGLVADGLWSKLDVLHVYATQDTTTAQLNLISSSYPATLNGAPTFTADRGYTGVAASTTVYIDTGFNPSAAPTPKYALNSSHVSAWSLTNATNSTGLVGAASTIHSYVTPNWNGTQSLYRINHANAVGTFANTDARGHYLANRHSTTGMTGFKNGAATYVGSTTSTGIPNLNFYSLAINNTGVANGSAQQTAMVSIGSSFDPTQALAFYNRLRTYMTAVGVP